MYVLRNILNKYITKYFTKNIKKTPSKHLKNVKCTQRKTFEFFEKQVLTIILDKHLEIAKCVCKNVDHVFKTFKFGFAKFESSI